MKKVRTEKGLTHVIFACCDCGENWEDYNTAMKDARAHALKHGHRVNGDVGYAIHYSGYEGAK